MSAKKTTAIASKSKTVKNVEPIESEIDEITDIAEPQSTPAEIINVLTEDSKPIKTATAKPSAGDKSTNSCTIGKCNYAGVAAVILLLLCGGILLLQNRNLNKRLAVLEQNITQMEGNFTQNVDNNRKIYVFNMDETVKGIGLQDANQKFESDINDLDAQVKDAEATIKGLKDEAMKTKILNLSIKPLQMKRDDLLEAYSASMQKYLQQINDALAQIATEKNIPVIFMNKAVAVNTNYVVDVTAEVIEKVKADSNKTK